MKLTMTKGVVFTQDKTLNLNNAVLFLISI